MKKRIVICADGTWNRPERNPKEDVPTNVLRLARAVSPTAPDGTPQQVFYDWGVGSYHDELVGGATGRGIQKNIMDGYRYVVQNYSPGDELFFFGFSRGAYTVRSLCGLINNCGILKRPSARMIQAAFNHYKRSGEPYSPKGTASKAFRTQYSYRRRQVRFLGVFDTVGALGIPFSWLGWLNPKDEFHDTKTGPNVAIARHALAINERRRDFEATVLLPRPNLDLRQVWFVGCHADIGGGYRPDGDRTLLSDVTLEWMTREARSAGLAFEDHLRKGLAPNPHATLHNSSSVKFRSWDDIWRPIDHGKGPVLIHRSVQKRWDNDRRYRPDNLKEYTAKHPNWRQHLEN